VARAQDASIELVEPQLRGLVAGLYPHEQNARFPDADG
jgi:hypothetical protein